MFEKAKPIPHAHSAAHTGAHCAVSPVESAALHALGRDDGGESLRRVEWTELTARLNAARDLRVVLRSETACATRAASVSLADAAARYFRAKDDDKPSVNPVALSDRKGSPGMMPGIERVETNSDLDRGRVTTGDARED